jgi:hypothetical protein
VHVYVSLSAFDWKAGIDLLIFSPDGDQWELGFQISKYIYLFKEKEVEERVLDGNYITGEIGGCYW